MIEVWTDGSVRGNPGIGGIAVVITSNNTIIKEFSGIVGHSVTSNEAEYQAVIKALELLIELDDGMDCIIYTDSKLVWGQTTQNWKVNFGRLALLRNKVKALMKSCPFLVTLIWSSRTNNVANKLAQTVTKVEKEKGFNGVQ